MSTRRVYPWEDCQAQPRAWREDLYELVVAPVFSRIADLISFLFFDLCEVYSEARAGLPRHDSLSSNRNRANEMCQNRGMAMNRGPILRSSIECR